MNVDGSFYLNLGIQPRYAMSSSDLLDKTASLRVTVVGCLFTVVLFDPMIIKH